MATMTVARCPKCQIEVGTTWRWCLACGYDPDGSAQRVRQAAIEARQREGGWVPVLIVLLGLLVGGTILWRQTPDDTKVPTEAPSTAAEVNTWVPFVPAGGGFTVDLPAPPVASSTDGVLRSGQPMESYAIGAGDHLFTVSVLDTKRSDLTPGNDAALESAERGYINDLAGAVSGEVTTADFTVEGTTARTDFHIADAAVGEMQGRVMAVGSRLVSVVVSSRALNDDIAGHATGSLVPA
jgi:hypothetical protein